MKIIVLKGWASTDNFYRDIFPFEFEIGFNNILCDEEIVVIAWSMGTLEALENLNKYNIKKLILIAPTRDFTLSTSERVLKLMVKNLKTNKSEVLENFIYNTFESKKFAMEYLSKYKEEIFNLDKEFLISGLEYLRTKKVEEIRTNINTLLILGSQDKIISNENSLEAISNFKNIKIVKLNKGHNLLFNNVEFIEIVRSFLSDK